MANGAVHNGLAVHRDAREKAVARRTQFKPVHYLFRTELPQLLNQRAINHDVSPSARFRSCGRGVLVYKNPNLSFPLASSPKLRGEGGKRWMRSAALPPMGACEVMQLRRDGSEAALEDRRGGIERSARHPFGFIRKHAKPLAQEKL
jgi:hypothetical protein